MGLRKPAGSTWNQVAHIVGMTAFADQEDDGTEEDNDGDSPTAQVGGPPFPRMAAKRQPKPDKGMRKIEHGSALC